MFHAVFRIGDVEDGGFRFALVGLHEHLAGGGGVGDLLVGDLGFVVGDGRFGLFVFFVGVFFVAFFLFAVMVGGIPFAWFLVGVLFVGVFISGLFLGVLALR
jgi:hypothetical protein